MYKITKELKDSLTNYLANRPYVETFQLIGELLKAEEIKEEKKEDKK